MELLPEVEGKEDAAQPQFCMPEAIGSIPAPAEIVTAGAVEECRCPRFRGISKRSLLVSAWHELKAQMLSLALERVKVFLLGGEVVQGLRGLL